MILAIDFDGTCVDHRYPAVGPDVPGAVEWLTKFAKAGAKLILWTMRSDGPRGEGSITAQYLPWQSIPEDVVPWFSWNEGETPLADAVAWFARNDIPLWAVNENPDQGSWTSSPKAYAHQLIDDAAYGCPLKENPRVGGRPYVDWKKVGPAVLAMIEGRSVEPSPGDKITRLIDGLEFTVVDANRRMIGAERPGEAAVFDPCGLDAGSPAPGGKRFLYAWRYAKDTEGT